MKRMERDDPQIELTALPIPKGFVLSPVKKCISDRVLIQPLVKSTYTGQPERMIKFNMVTSPRKVGLNRNSRKTMNFQDLRDINRIVGSAHAQNRYQPAGTIIYKSKT